MGLGEILEKVKCSFSSKSLFCVYLINKVSTQGFLGITSKFITLCYIFSHSIPSRRFTNWVTLSFWICNEVMKKSAVKVTKVKRNTQGIHSVQNLFKKLKFVHYYTAQHLIFNIRCIKWHCK